MPKCKQQTNQFSLPDFTDKKVVEVQRSKLVTLTVVELVLELDPVETKSMQVTLQGIHNQKDEKSDQREEDEENIKSNGITRRKTRFKNLTPEDFRQLRVSKRQSPETEVGSSMRNTTQAVLNSLFTKSYQTSLTSIAWKMKISLKEVASSSS